MDLLLQWIAQNSHSHNPEGLAKMADLLDNSFRRLPAKGRRIPLPPYRDIDDSTIHPGSALHYSWNPEAKTRVFLSGHMDTVYPIDHPFQNVEWHGDDHLIGPGAADMKGGLYVILKALEEFHQSSAAEKIGYELLITGDEEIGSHASRCWIEQLASPCQLAMVFETCLPNQDIVRNRKGNGSFRFTVHGKSAHTGRDFEKGKNAIAALARLVEHIHGLNHQLEDTIINVGKIEGGGPLNVVPDKASAFINVRYSNPAKGEKALKALQDLLKTFPHDCGYRLESEGDLSRPAAIQGDSFSDYWQRYAEIADQTGLRSPGFGDTGGASDGNFLVAKGIPSLDGVGAIGGSIHSPEEYIIPSLLEPKISLTHRFLASLADDSPEK